MSTARLKRKLGDLGIDSSSKRANESFCLIGTPLPPLEKSRDTGEFVPLWKQDVRDEKGRRRLHGAFTGGFSAGYFNTVGSKEGWAPSTFVSSRSERAKNRGARPEDFMDEEDLADIRADQKLVDENEEMDLTGGTQAEMSKRGQGDTGEKDEITVALEQSLLPTPKDSIGARILKKMGWRLGQGIGPRITWRQREIQFGRNPDVDSTEADEEAKRHMYAPRDTPLLIVGRKDDSHGLGYNSGLGLHATLGSQGPNNDTKGPKLAGGFGLGALNDADEDDLDVYDSSNMHTRNRTAYDASDMYDEERIVMGNKQHGQPTGRSSAKAQAPARPTLGKGTFRDGTHSLEGFVVSDKPVAEDQWFPIPDIPAGWTPNPKRVWEQAKVADSNKENTATAPPPIIKPSEPQTHSQWKTGISADQRGAILGETPLPTGPRSVFEFISKKDQERIKSAAGGRSDQPSSPDFIPATSSPESSSAPSLPHTEVHVAQSALRGFQPFTADPAKQVRYTAYLQAHANPGSGASIPAQLSGQDVETYAREMRDYAKAAALFRPISGAMAGRFTSAAVLDLGPKIVEGLHTPAAESALNDEDEKMDVDEKVDERREEAPKVHAARVGMFGALTREVTPWQPARLLCKRFGVKDPNPDVTAPQAAASSSTAPAQPEFTAEAVAAGTVSMTASLTTAPSARKDLSHIGLGDEDGMGDDILTYERPAMDVFKAIFASDDEESDVEMEVDDKVEAKDQRQDTLTPALPPPSASDGLLDSGPSTSISRPSKPDSAPEVDLASFKPTFIPRDPKSKKAKGKDKEVYSKEKKDKKKKSSSKGATLVSFELDEDGTDSISFSAQRSKHRDKERDQDRFKKKKRKEKDGDEDDMWVEKPPPDIVKGLVAEIPPDDNPDIVEDAGPVRGRKRAVDFM
ncbi:hypothetical protein BJ138DRAFT_195776 [Hygrophoropsis aurantiaca]|uniref:Uncharacterized protein n=1 Tax=Hygrophoropsis aurantiaca TaxID=72124 RepID=A0ACB8AAE5_9AGAM|nr:hypothetical protein BJ138DRAFT_195776 [Hygrophoropsis aurantiaca]